MSDTKNEKNQKLAEIKNLIHGFCEINLNPQFERYCFKLCDALGRKRKVDIRRSTTAQWAASIIYVIARLNFLFDHENEYNITAETICDYFQTKKSTAGNKASQIQKLCNLSMGAEGYCSEDIRDLFIFYQTESGFIIPKFMMNETRTSNDLTRLSKKYEIC